MENEIPKNNLAAAFSRPFQKMTAPLRRYWVVVDARYGKIINIFILLAIFVFFGLVIFLLKGYVQFI